MITFALAAAGLLLLALGLLLPALLGRGSSAAQRPQDAQAIEVGQVHVEQDQARALQARLAQA